MSTSINIKGHQRKSWLFPHKMRAFHFCVVTAVPHLPWLVVVSAVLNICCSSSTCSFGCVSMPTHTHTHTHTALALAFYCINICWVWFLPYVPVFQLGGCGLLGVGVWLSVSQGSFATLSPSFPSFSAANLIITLGTVVMVTGFLGCLGAIKENKCLLLSVSGIHSPKYTRPRIRNVLCSLTPVCCSYESPSPRRNNCYSEWDLPQSSVTLVHLVKK